MNLQYRKDKGKKAVKKPGVWLLCMLLVIVTAAACVPAMAAPSETHQRGVKASAEQHMLRQRGVKASAEQHMLDQRGVKASAEQSTMPTSAPSSQPAQPGQTDAAGEVQPVQRGQGGQSGQSGQVQNPKGKAVAGDFDIQIRTGLDGKYLYSMPMPIQVRITDRESDFEGTFRIIIPSSGYMSKASAYETPILLTKGSEKLISLTVNEMNMIDKPRIQILDAAGKVAAQTTVVVSGSASEGVLCGVLTDDFASLGYLRYAMIDVDGAGTSVDLAELNEDNFPDQESMLECLSYIVISDFDTSSLNDGQMTALVKWIKRGGILICGTGSEYRRVLSGLETPLSAEGISLTISPYEGGKAADASEESKQPGQSGAGGSVVDLPAAKGMVKIEVSGGEKAGGIVTDSSLVTAVPLGKGGLAFTGFSLTMEPLASLDETAKQTFADDLLDNLPRSVGVTHILRGTGQTGYIYDPNVISNAFESVVPRMSLIEILLVIFCLLVGPILYLILKKMDKRGLLWVLIPVSSLVITGLIFFTNRQLWMGAIRTASLTVISLEDGEAVQEPKVSMVIESPSIGTGKVQFSPDMDHLICGQLDPDMYYPGPDTAQRKDYDFDTAVSYTGEGYEMTALADTAFEKFFLGMDYCGEDRFDHAFESDLKCEPGRIEGTLTNRSGKNFTSVCLVNGQFFMDLGPMEDGAKIVVDDINLGTLNYSSFYDVYFQAFEQYSAEYNAYVNIMSTLTENYLGTDSLTNLYICAYSDSWDADYVRNEEVKEFNRVMVIDHINVLSESYPDGYLVRCSDTQYVADQGNWWDNYQGVQKVKVTFMIGGSIPTGKVIGMYLDTSDYRSAGEPEGTMTLYNYQTRQYEDPFKKDNMISFSGDCPYISPDGLEIRAEYTTAAGMQEGPTPILYLIGGDDHAEN